jgi:predicted outer membrane repeat protein
MNKNFYRTYRIVLIALLCANFVFTANAQQTVRRYVKWGASGIGINGWDYASPDLQAMIDTVYNRGGGEVWVAESPSSAKAYRPMGNHNYFVMKEGVKIYGGFPLSGNPGMEDRNWQTHKTYLKPKLNTTSSVIRNDNNNLTQAAELNGFIITGGYTNKGGGIYNYRASPLIKNCTIQECYAVSLMGYAIGGGAYNKGSNAMYENVIFVNNSTHSLTLAGLGGAVANINDSTKFLYCIFRNNSAENGYGGAFYMEEGALNVIACRIVSNSAAYGGGIYLKSDTSTVCCGSIDSNRSQHGGAIYQESGISLIYNNSVWHNQADQNGGAIYLNSGTIKGSGNSISYNHAYNGGGIYLNGGTYAVKSTISLNYADHGGGIYNNGGTFLQTETAFSIAQNSAIKGAGIYNKGAVEYSFLMPGTTTRLIISANHASQDGGGIFNEDVTYVWPKHFFITHNVADNHGGGIFNQGGTHTFNYVNVFSNRAKNGGGVYNDSVTALFKDQSVGFFPPCSENRAIEKGGAFFNNHSTISMENLLLQKDTAQDGGAIYNNYSNLTIVNTTITENIAHNSGGGIYNRSGKLNVNQVAFSTNKAVNGSGGAIYAVWDTLSFANSEFKQNSALIGGGALNLANSYAESKENKFYENNAQNGGAINAMLSQGLHVSNDFFQNKAQNGGALYLCYGTNQTYDKCAFEENGTYNYTIGGAIYCDGTKGGDALFTNALIASNQGKFGAGIYCDRMTLGIIHNTITENKGREGSGLFYVDRVNSAIRCDNSIIWKNSGMTGNSIQDNVSNTTHTGNNITFKYCDIQDADVWNVHFLGTNNGLNIADDPLLYPSPNYRLIDQSPCIGFCPNMLPNDKDGNPRPFGPRSDAGCYENQFVNRSLLQPSTEEETLSASATASSCKLYPNPVLSGENLTVELTLINEEAAATVEIYNLMGSKLLHTTIKNGQNELPLPATAGTYFVRISTATGEVIGREKITVQ